MTTDKTPATLATAKHGGCVQLGDGWSGWATQYPGKMPKLCGAREIAELNHYPEEGQRLIFLSEQPVQAGALADAARAALPFVAYAFSQGVTGAEEAGRAIETSLSAQPSPGGQDALAALQQDYDKLLDSFNRQVEVAEKIAGRALQQDDRIEELEEALAARQPAGVAFPWENFPAYLIDKCEGDTISEEGLQQALAAMAKDERYCLAARQPVGEIPAGFVLVPEKFGIPAEVWEGVEFVIGGPGTGEGEAYLDSTAWVGDLIQDDGSAVYGLHLSCDECPEEGSVTLSVFTARAEVQP